MSRLEAVVDPMTPTAAATGALEETLGRALGKGVGAVTIVDRRPSSYRSTFPLEELTVRSREGVERKLIFKDLSRGMADSAWEAKAPFLGSPTREIEVYRDVLSPSGLSVPDLYAWVIDSGSGRSWLFLESVDGDPLWQRGDAEAWDAAADWLARMHVSFSESRLPRGLVSYGADYWSHWLARVETLVRWPVDAGGRSRDYPWLARRCEDAIAWLVEQPPTLVHGEFYPANVVVESCRGRARIRPVDWETAGVGVGLLDLAALTSGLWDEERRTGMVEAYRSALPARVQPSAAELARGLSSCRLLVALQWLGWSRSWTPPPEQAHDWLASALELAMEVTA